MPAVEVSPMKVDVQTTERNITVVTAVGSLTIGPSEDVMNATVSRLLADRQTRLVIDVAGIKKIDSSGIETLLVACQRARELGGDVKLAGVPSRFQTLLEIAHLTNVLQAYPDVAAALSSF